MAKERESGEYTPQIEFEAGFPSLLFAHEPIFHFLCLPIFNLIRHSAPFALALKKFFPVPESRQRIPTRIRYRKKSCQLMHCGKNSALTQQFKEIKVNFKSGLNTFILYNESLH